MRQSAPAYSHKVLDVARHQEVTVKVLWASIEVELGGGGKLEL